MDPLRTQRDALTRANLLDLVGEVDRHLARETEHRPDLAGPISEWRRELRSLPAAVRSAEAVIAFVGAVKSGKSTLVNALLGEDVLPRGSGILTAQVTEVRGGARSRLRVAWKPRPVVERLFAQHLAALGHAGDWRLGDPGHRARAVELLEAGSSRPEKAPVRALLKGYEEVERHLGERVREEYLEDLSTLASWAARDEIAIFLEGLRVELPVADLPTGIALLDCQGSDAWNAAHGEALETALLGAHALVYVVSGRVGLREADHRLLEVLRNLGLLQLTRFVLNVDLGEVRSGAELERVAASAREALREIGISEGVWIFSCLQGLLDRRVLVAPETVTTGERRLLEAWESAAGASASDSRNQFQTFKRRLWAEAQAERERLVILRGKTDLQRILVGASTLLRSRGRDPLTLDRAAWEAGTLDEILAWARHRMEDAAEREKSGLRRAVAEKFSAPRAPQRRLWESRINRLPETVVWARLEGEVEDLLAETEPLRIHAIRNLALEVRGSLAREGEALGRETASLLTDAGVVSAPPPGRHDLAREISASRKIPVFRGRFAGRAAARSPDPSSSVAGAVGHLLAAPLRRRRRTGEVLERAEGALQRARIQRSARSAWRDYIGAVLDRCLIPHVDDVAAQVYAAVATWAMAQVGTGAGLGQVLSALSPKESQTPVRETPRRKS